MPTHVPHAAARVDSNHPRAQPRRCDLQPGRSEMEPRPHSEGQDRQDGRYGKADEAGQQRLALRRRRSLHANVVGRVEGNPVRAGGDADLEAPLVVEWSAHGLARRTDGGDHLGVDQRPTVVRGKLSRDRHHHRVVVGRGHLRLRALRRRTTREHPQQPRRSSQARGRHSILLLATRHGPRQTHMLAGMTRTALVLGSSGCRGAPYYTPCCATMASRRW